MTKEIFVSLCKYWAQCSHLQDKINSLLVFSEEDFPPENGDGTILQMATNLLKEIFEKTLKDPSDDEIENLINSICDVGCNGPCQVFDLENHTNYTLSTFEDLWDTDIKYDF